ncbi:hypothetical protein N9L68_03765 [bacterium]|nr:hypothetical protein [bacterium]
MPYISLPETDMEGGDDSLALAMVASEKHTSMKGQALRIQAKEAKSGHHLQGTIITMLNLMIESSKRNIHINKQRTMNMEQGADNTLYIKQKSEHRQPLGMQNTDNA